MSIVIFAINPGSTSTKTALFADETCLHESVVRHDAASLQAYPTLASQLPLRLAAVEAALQEALRVAGLPGPASIDAFVGRGGLTHGLPSGTYRVNAAMLSDLSTNRYGVHASNLGAQIADSLASQFGKPAYIVDPVSVDEMIDVARYSGLPQIRRKSTFHALNQKAVARQAAGQLGRPYESVNLIVAHMGGGISIGAHRHGRVIDVNNALEEGPFSPERAGTLPSLQLLDLYESGTLTPGELRKLLVGRGGLFAYTGTIDVKAIEEAAAVRTDYAECLAAMTYQIAKQIGAMAVSLAGQVDAIVLTGGLAYSQGLTGDISRQVGFIAPVLVYPGENELPALAAGARRVLCGAEIAKEYLKED